MVLDNDDDDDPFTPEEVERRQELRGVFPGLKIEIFDPKPGAYDAVEASRRSFFVRCDDPEAHRLGEVVVARISLAGQEASCRLEVIRKEIEPRHGFALRLQFVDPANEAILEGILGSIEPQTLNRK